MTKPVVLTECVAQSNGLRILVVLPAPLNDPGRVAAEQELQAVFGALDDLRIGATLVRLNPPTLESLATAASLAAFNIIHIGGHGSSNGIELETDSGLARTASYAELADALAGNATGLVVLTGCATEALADQSTALADQSNGRSASATIAVAGNMSREDSLWAVGNIYRRVLTGYPPQRVAEELSRALQGRSGRRRGAGIVARGPRAGDSMFDPVSGVAETTYYDCRPVTNIRPRREPLFGREYELVKLSDWMSGRADGGYYMGIVGITGSGKTALAAAAAERYGWRFPSGIVYFAETDGFSAEQLAKSLEWDLTDVPQVSLATEVAKRLSRGRYLLIFDDVDYYDASSYEAMIELLDRWDLSLGGRALFICHTRAAEFRRLVGTNWTMVDDLPPDAATELLQALLGGARAASAMVGNQLAEAAQLCFRHARTIQSVAGLLTLGHSYLELRDDLVNLEKSSPLEVNTKVLTRVISSLEQRAPVSHDMLDCLMVLSTTCRESTWRRLTRAVIGETSETQRATAHALDEMQGARLIERYRQADDARCSVHPLVMAHVRAHGRVSEAKMRTLVGAHLKIQADIYHSDPAYPTDEIDAILRSLDLARRYDMHREIIEFCSTIIGSRRSPIVRRGPWRIGLELLALGEAAASEDDDHSSMARFALVRGTIEYRLTRFDAAAEAYKTARALAREAGDTGLEVEALKGEGQVLYRTGQFAAAERVYVQGRELAQTLDELALADMDHQLAKVLYRRGDYAAARIRLQAARQVREAAGNQRREVAKTTHELGRIEHASGELAAARRLYLEALQIERSIDDPVMEQATLFQLGRLDIDEGDLETAAEHLRESRAISEGLGDPLWMVHADFGSALLARAGGDGNARAYGEDALKKARALGIGLGDEIAAWLHDLEADDGRDR